MTPETLQNRRDVLKATGGALVAGLAGCAGAPEETPTPESTPTATESPTASPAGNGGGGNSVTVGPGGELTFDPSSLTISAGTEVTWTWDSSGHNIVVASQPDEASWQGTPGSEDELYDEGYTYSHSFDPTGTYEYYCQPHRSAGMTGTITVEG